MTRRSSFDSRPAHARLFVRHGLVTGRQVGRERLSGHARAHRERDQEHYSARDISLFLESVVSSLIHFRQEHSGPFLQKVRKSDVPDYYDGQ